MPDSSLDLRYLRFALLVAEHGSFRRVAAALDISQSTVSRRVKLLERRIGAVLFERNHLGAHLTPAAEQFLRSAAAGAQHLNEAVLNIAKMGRLEGGELRIGIVASLSGGPLAKTLEAYRRRFPYVKIHIQETTGDVGVGLVRNGLLDAVFLSTVVADRACMSRPLWETKLFVCLPSTHPGAHWQSVQLEQLGEERFLISPKLDGRHVEELIVRNLSRCGFSPNVESHDVGIDNLISLVALRYGVAVTNLYEPRVNPLGVVLLPVEGAIGANHASVLWLEKNPNPALRRLLHISSQQNDANNQFTTQRLDT